MSILTEFSIFVKILENLDFVENFRIFDYNKKNSKISISAKIYKNLDLRKNLQKSRFRQNFRKNIDFCKRNYKKLVYRQNFRSSRF